MVEIEGHGASPLVPKGNSGTQTNDALAPSSLDTQSRIVVGHKHYVSPFADFECRKLRRLIGEENTYF